jgi:hypothetical protein
MKECIKQVMDWHVKLVKLNVISEQTRNMDKNNEEA